ncbi:LysR family transcriptional regulator [Moraxella oblonga]|uniref:LysR family transcriptional regulator n=1 Tax=Moraxella oblonga TaxID=200413 RepID=UPI0008368CF8|nr:LysR family transcriptional regulator [Moraxella oblonga]
MDTLTSIQVFHQIVAQGSFTKASDSLDMSVAMASKHIMYLEKQLGAKLLHRNSRNIHLTQAGQEYYRQSLYALEVLNHAKLTAMGATDKPQGVLKITMPRWFANPKVSGYLAQFRERYPDVVLNLSLSNQLVDLVADGFDLALRLTHDPKPSLIARPLGVVDFYLVASPSYLAKHGIPTHPKELEHHHIILPTYNKSHPIDITHRISKERMPIYPKTAMMSDDTPMNAELVRQGVGIGYAPSWLVEQDLANGNLVQLFTDYEIFSVQLCAVYTDRAFLRANVRAFIDFWVEQLS